MEFKFIMLQLIKDDKEFQQMKHDVINCKKSFNIGVNSLENEYDPQIREAINNELIEYRKLINNAQKTIQNIEHYRQKYWN